MNELINQLRNLRIGESHHEPDYMMMRVPGGWIYHMYDYKKERHHLVGTFIPIPE